MSVPRHHSCDDGAVNDTVRRSRPGSSPPRDPLVGVERLLLDGNNLLHAISTGPAAAPQAALIGRLRAVIPADIRIEIVFDGPPDKGLHGTRLAHGLTVRHAGRLTADALLLRLVMEATGGIASSPTPALLVVTDDGRLAQDLRTRGAATLGTSWIVRRLARPRLAAPSVGRPRPPAGSGIGDRRAASNASHRRRSGPARGTGRRGGTNGLATRSRRDGETRQPEARPPRLTLARHSGPRR